MRVDGGMKDVVERRVSATLSGGGPGANIPRNHVSGREVDLSRCCLLPGDRGWKKAAIISRCI